MASRIYSAILHLKTHDELLPDTSQWGWDKSGLRYHILENFEMLHSKRCIFIQFIWNIQWCIPLAFVDYGIVWHLSLFSIWCRPYKISCVFALCLYLRHRIVLYGEKLTIGPIQNGVEQFYWKLLQFTWVMPHYFSPSVLCWRCNG